MPRKLTADEKSLLRLIARDQVNPTGWAKTSKIVMSAVQMLPHELVEFRVRSEGDGIVCLTELGQSLIKAMEYL